jgi:hypothetical protein
MRSGAEPPRVGRFYTHRSMTRLSLLCAISILCTLLSVAQADPLTAADRKHFGPISAGILGAADVTLFEGLPHQMFERDLLASELKSKKTVQQHGFSFYQRPLPLSAADAAALRRLLTSKDTYETFGGEKFCGGFHPDYSLAWVLGTQTIHVQICFGCDELKLFGTGHELRTDADNAAITKLRAILKKYRAQRPKPRNG